MVIRPAFTRMRQTPDLPGTDAGTRPPRAVIGAQISHDEELFGRVFDARVMRRFAGFVWPYRRTAILALLAVLVFVVTQLSIPLVILYAIDAYKGNLALFQFLQCWLGALNQNDSPVGAPGG